MSGEVEVVVSQLCLCMEICKYRQTSVLGLVCEMAQLLTMDFKKPMIHSDMWEILGLNFVNLVEESNLTKQLDF